MTLKTHETKLILDNKFEQAVKAFRKRVKCDEQTAKDICWAWKNEHMSATTQQVETEDYSQTTIYWHKRS